MFMIFDAEVLVKCFAYDPLYYPDSSPISNMPAAALNQKRQTSQESISIVDLDEVQSSRSKFNVFRS